MAESHLPSSPRKGPRFIGSPAASLDEAAARFGEERGAQFQDAARRFPVRFPREYLELATPGESRDPIRTIGWPDAEESAIDPHGLGDPVGEKELLVHRLVIRKHSDRVVLLVTSRCHFYCRFCFRAVHRKEPSLDEIGAAVRAIGELADVREVILSGGDPLVLPDGDLASIVAQLARTKNVRAIRIHTRAPVHDPARVTRELPHRLAAASPLPLRIVVHATHPRELRPALERALGHFRSAALPLLNQTVLLRGVNDDEETLAALFSGLAERGVAPHYLHHPDRVPGSGRFRVTIGRGLSIFRSLVGAIPAAALPRYVVDLPDGSGKVPVEQLEPLSQGVWRYIHPGPAVPGRAPVSIYRDIDAP